MRPHVHARTVRGASRALTMAIAFGFSRRDRGVLVKFANQGFAAGTVA